MYQAANRYGAALGARYQQVDIDMRVEGASPHALIMILFEELLKNLDTLRAAERTNTGPRYGGTQARVVSIIQGLNASLDHGKGGAVAGTLDKVYRQALRLVTTPWGPQRLPALDHARTILGDIAGAWATIN